MDSLKAVFNWMFGTTNTEEGTMTTETTRYDENAVMDLVTDRIHQNPDISNDELREIVEGEYPGVKNLSARQFNAKWPLQVKRQMKADLAEQAGNGKAKVKAEEPAAKPVTAIRESDSGFNRDKIRKTLLTFGKNLLEAESRGDVVDEVAGVDEYVDYIEKLYTGIKTGV